MDTALALMEMREPVYPLDIVQTMRDQRACMVQNVVSIVGVWGWKGGGGLLRGTTDTLNSSSIAESISIRLRVHLCCLHDDHGAGG